MSEFRYVGDELKIFAEAHRWKAYWSERLRPFIRGDVLEVGAGIGANTQLLAPESEGRWVCLEPDPELLEQLKENATLAGRTVEARCGTIDGLDRESQFDTILYIDVLEHIERDREELNAAAAHLRRNGRMIVLSPAHQWLFSPFDAAIGHFRRYARPALRSLSPEGLRLEELFYLDSAGLVLSAANRLFLRQSMPTKSQIAFWNKYVIPVSRVMDGSLGNNLGKSIVAIWQRD